MNQLTIKWMYVNLLKYSNICIDIFFFKNDFVLDMSLF